MKRNSKTARLTVGAMLAALSIILPQVFHLTGIPQVGAVFLPMHIPVLLAGFILGPVYGAVIGAVSPAVSFLITNMPTAEKLPFMVAELMFYGLSSGLLYHVFKLKSVKFGAFFTLIIAMVCGRAVNALALWAAAKYFGIDCGGAMAAVTSTVTGIYGIALQFITIPPIVYALRRSEFIQ